MKALIIHESGAIAMEDLKTHEDLNRVIGGYLEGIDLDTTFAFINEEGKHLQMDVNQKATAIFHHYHPRCRHECIVGPMAIVGPTNSEGDSTDVPQDWIDNLIKRDWSTL